MRREGEENIIVCQDSRFRLGGILVLALHTNLVKECQDSWFRLGGILALHANLVKETRWNMPVASFGEGKQLRLR